MTNIFEGRLLVTTLIALIMAEGYRVIQSFSEGDKKVSVCEKLGEIAYSLTTFNSDPYKWDIQEI